MYEKSIVSTSGEVLSNAGSDSSFYSLTSYDLGYVPFGKNSSWAGSIISSSTMPVIDSVVVGIFSDLTTPSFWMKLTSSFLAPKSFVKGSTVYTVHAQSSGCVAFENNCELHLGILYAFVFDGTNIPKPVMKQMLFSADVFPSILKDKSCGVEPNAFILLEDQFVGSGVVTLAVSCPRGPVILDVTPDNNSSFGDSRTEQRVCNPFGPVVSNCNCTVTTDPDSSNVLTCGKNEWPERLAKKRPVT